MITMSSFVSIPQRFRRSAKSPAHSV